jgi:hypothetical protein
VTDDSKIEVRYGIMRELGNQFFLTLMAGVEEVVVPKTAY